MFPACANVSDPSQEPPKRGPGRTRGSKNKPKEQDDFSPEPEASQSTKSQLDKVRRLEQRNPTLQPIMEDTSSRILPRKSNLSRSGRATGQVGSRGLLSSNGDSRDFEDQISTILEKDVTGTVPAKPRKPLTFNLTQDFEDEDDEVNEVGGLKTWNEEEEEDIEDEDLEVRGTSKHGCGSDQPRDERRPPSENQGHSSGLLQSNISLIIDLIMGRARPGNEYQSLPPAKSLKYAVI